MIGRYCGSLTDKLTQMACVHDAASRFVGLSDGIHAEIGMLFGGSALAKLMVLRELGVEQRVLGIDPFVGWYDKKNDPDTGLPVTAENVTENVRRFNLDPQALRIVQGFSGDPRALDAVRAVRVLTLLIDGDHSYDGVMKDWENYSPTVEPGGYVLFDDYSDPTWQGVTRAVDQIVGEARGWRVFGKFDTTLVLQRT